MPEEITLRKSFTPKETVRSFNGEPSDPTPLPPNTPYSVGPDSPASSTDATSGGVADSSQTGGDSSSSGSSEGE
jgi:hypothetical protein